MAQSPETTLHAPSEPVPVAETLTRDLHRPTAQATTITIIGSGSSAKGIPFERLPGTKIGVNDAGLLARADIVVSMDRVWSEARWKRLQERQRDTWLRRSAVQNIAIADAPWLTVFDNSHIAVVMAPPTARSEHDAPILNGTHSGMCALNLAYRMVPRVIYLVGFDHCRDPKTGAAYWHDPYEWAHPGGATPESKYITWASQYRLIAGQMGRAGIKVFNASPISRITQFTKIKIGKILT